MVDDKIKAIANAIATAEGFFVSGSIAQRTNNPGDLGTSGSKVNSFSTLQAGWDALYNQVSMILDGSSHYYKPTMTISQVAKIYVDGPKANGMSQGATDWANNVAKELGMTATEVLATYEGKPTTEELTVNPTLQMLLSLFTLGEQTVAALAPNTSVSMVLNLVGTGIGLAEEILGAGAGTAKKQMVLQMVTAVLPIVLGTALTPAGTQAVSNLIDGVVALFNQTGVLGKA